MPGRLACDGSALSLGLMVVVLLALPAVSRAQGPAVRAEELALLPVPASVTVQPGTLRVDERFTVSLEGVCDELVARAATRFLERLQARTGLPVRPTPLDSGTGTLQVRCSQAGPPLTESANESYTLDVTPRGARLDAPTTTGVLRGLATLQQLVRLGAGGVTAQAVHVDDAPRFTWRGLLLDVSRHFATTDAIRRTLDAMESVKLNVLHLHLCDTEGFRVESLKYPRLTAYPSSGGQFYTQADIRAIVAAAGDRGIRVVPEFEMPGHAQSLLIAYPELGSGPAFGRGRSPESMNAALDPSRESTYEFLAGLLGEMATLFPDSAVHVAGDEVQSAHWAKNAGIQAFMRQRGFGTPHELQAYFTGRVASILSALGKTPIVWDEAVGPGLPPNVIVEAWRSSKMVQRAAAAGYRTIVSAGYYLDRDLPAAEHYAVDPFDTRAFGLSAGTLQAVKGTPLEPYVTEAMVVSDALPLTEADKARIVGGEAAIWTELVPDGNLEMHTWPRAAAVAERLWSPAAVRDQASLLRRLELVSTDLELQGLQHRAASVRALQRLAAGGDLAPLVTLGETVQPLKHLGRLMPIMQGAMAGETSSTYFPPMNRFSDAVPPESPVARRFNEEAVRAAAPVRDAAARAWVRARLVAWRDNDAALAATAAGSALLAEVVPVSAEVRRLAEAGLEALDALDSGASLPSTRAEALRALVAPYVKTEAANANAITALMAPHPAHGLSIAIVPGVAALVEGAGRQR